MRLTLKEQSECGMLVRGGKNGMGCYVRGDKNCMGCYVRGDKHSMGCFVWGGKSLWDVLSGVSKNGMGCFVPGCFVRLPPYTVIQNLGPFHIFMSPPQGSIDILFSPCVCLAVCLTFHHTVFFRHCLAKNLTPFSDPIITWSEHHYTH